LICRIWFYELPVQSSPKRLSILAGTKSKNVDMVSSMPIGAEWSVGKRAGNINGACLAGIALSGTEPPRERIPSKVALGS
jgi:hypothetical protein